MPCPKILRAKFFRHLLIAGAVVTAVLALVGVTFSLLLRNWALGGLPDIPEPFDIDAVAFVNVSAEDNAFELYKLATEALRAIPDDLKERTWDSARIDWSEIPESWRLWLGDSGEALDLYLQGSEKTLALYIQPGEKTPTTQLTVTQNLQYLLLLAVFEARRLADEGDYAAAWDWHFAVLRSSRHSGRNGGLIERLVGCAMFARAIVAITDWSSLSGLDTELLQRALRDLREVDKQTVPTSESIKVEYVEFRRVLNEPQLLDQIFEEKQLLEPSTVRRLSWPLGEPQATCRLAKIVNRNWLSQCDLPREQRSSIITSQGLQFTPDPSAGPLSAEATRKQLESWMTRSIFRQFVVAYIPEFLDAADLDTARRRILATALVLQLYHHECGGYPEALDQLLGHECEALPVDPFANGKPLKYRRAVNPDEGITLWSVGRDGINNDGIGVSGDDQRNGDIVLNLKSPRRKTE